MNVGDAFATPVAPASDSVTPTTQESSLENIVAENQTADIVTDTAEDIATVEEVVDETPEDVVESEDVEEEVVEEDIDEEEEKNLEFIKNKPEVILKTITNLNEKVIHYKTESDIASGENKILKEKLSELQKQIAHSKFDDASLPIRDDERALWLAQNRFKDDPNNEGKRVRYKQLLKERLEQMDDEFESNVVQQEAVKPTKEVKEEDTQSSYINRGVVKVYKK